MKLEWDKPEFDGGSTITGYIIEKRDKQFQKWEVCARSEGETPVCKVSGLIEGSIYEFRVRAVNKAGESVPSDPSIPHRLAWICQHIRSRIFATYNKLLRASRVQSILNFL